MHNYTIISIIFTYYPYCYTIEYFLNIHTIFNQKLYNFVHVLLNYYILNIILITYYLYYYII